jgi:hypothetical protein
MLLLVMQVTYNKYIERQNMQYFINKKNIKQSVNNISNFLIEKKIDIPKNIILELFSKGLFFKNWNTLNGLCSKPKIIQNLSNRKAYLLEIDTDLNEKELLKLVKNSFKEGNCNCSIDNFLFEDNSFHLEINFPNKTDNFLTGIFILSEELKKFNTTRCEIFRIVFEKENLSRLFDNKIKNKSKF